MGGCQDTSLYYLRSLAARTLVGITRGRWLLPVTPLGIPAPGACLGACATCLPAVAGELLLATWHDRFLASWQGGGGSKPSKRMRLETAPSIRKRVGLEKATIVGPSSGPDIRIITMGWDCVSQQLEVERPCPISAWSQCWSISLAKEGLLPCDATPIVLGEWIVSSNDGKVVLRSTRRRRKCIKVG